MLGFILNDVLASEKSVCFPLQRVYDEEVEEPVVKAETEKAEQVRVLNPSAAE